MQNSFFSFPILPAEEMRLKPASMGALVALLLCALIPTAADEVQVVAPIALSHAGPQHYFQFNSTAVGGSLRVLDKPMSHFCDPERSEAERTAINGRTVMLSFDLSGGCDWESAYLNLVEAGSQAILVYSKTGLRVPGSLHRTRGHDVGAFVDASQKPVPMLHISKEESDTLERHMAVADTQMNDDGEPILHLIIESSENEWALLFDSDAWTVVMRRIVPLGYFLVATTGLYVAVSTEPKRGGTRCWVAHIEMFPAMVLFFVSLAGVYEGDVLPRDVQFAFFTHFLLSETVSTVLVARYWDAQATAAKHGFEHGLAADPQFSDQAT